MVNLSEYELRLIAKNRGIKNYKYTTREKLLSTSDETERNLKYYIRKRTQSNRKNAEFFT